MFDSKMSEEKGAKLTLIDKLPFIASSLEQLGLMKTIIISLSAIWVFGCSSTPPLAPAHDRYEVYVYGEVQKPGSVLPMGDVDVSWAIKASGGYTAAADMKRVQIVHTWGQRGIETINEKAVAQGKIYDLRISAGDEIWVRKKSQPW